MANNLASRVDEVDVQMDRIARLIDGGARMDPELAAGLGCSESLGSIEKTIDAANLAVLEFGEVIRQAARR